MTDEQINAAIAKVCGWEVQLSLLQSGLEIVRDGKRKPLPNYCTDLNAMHEAEKTLKTTDSHEYANMLYDIACKNQEQNGKWLPYSISARQRAEAFLRTLGKWEEVQK